MRLRDDDRGQSIQIGAVLLFAVLIVAFSSYQAFVVPDQNREVEFNHNQQVHGEMQELRNQIVSVAGGGTGGATSVTLGTTYPSRLVALNPGPASGTLRTAGTTDDRVNVSIENAVASGETGDVWDGDPRSYNTGAVVYSPGYNLYTNAPDTTYEQSVLYNEFRSGTIVLANQAVVDGDRISLVALNGSFDRGSAATTSLDVRSVSSSERTVPVTDDGTNITITFASRLGADRWDQLLSDEENVVDVRPAGGSAPDGFSPVAVELAGGVDYRLRLTKVGIGTGVTDEPASYVTDVRGNDTTVAPDGTQRLVAEVRDDYNNPVAGRTVNATVVSGGGSVTPTDRTSDGEGRVAFTYEAPSTGTSAEIRVDIADAPSGREMANFTVSVDGSGGSGGGQDAYTTTWVTPSGPGVDCSTDPCTLDASVTRSVDLTATTSPTAADAEVRYSLSNQSVATLDPRVGRTNDTGDNETTLTATDSGTTYVYTASGGSGDRLQFEISNLQFTQIAFVSGATGELGTIGSGGGITTYTTDRARAIAPVGDYGSGTTEVPYVNNSNSLNVVEADGTTRQIAPQAKYGGATIAAGDRDGDGTTEYYYTETDNGNLVVTEGGTTSPVETTSGNNCNGSPSSIQNGYGAAGLADFDTDGSQDLVLVNGNDKIAYFDFQECSLTEATTNFDVGSGNGGVGVSAPFEYEGRPVVAFVNGNGDFVIVDETGNVNGASVALASSYGGAAPSPLGAKDWDDDGDLELLHIDDSDGNSLKHAGIQDADLVTVTNENGDPVPAERDSGTR